MGVHVAGQAGGLAALGCAREGDLPAVGRYGETDLAQPQCGGLRRRAVTAMNDEPTSLVWRHGVQPHRPVLAACCGDLDPACVENARQCTRNPLDAAAHPELLDGNCALDLDVAA